MKFITVREFRSSTASMWRKLKKERQLVVTRRGKPVALITSTDEDAIGDTVLADLRRKALAAVDDIRREAKRQGVAGMKMSEIDAVIAESRREKRNANRA